jgi:hypothetical protein
VLEKHIYHPYGLFDGEAEKANAAKGSVQGPPLSGVVNLLNRHGRV